MTSGKMFRCGHDICDEIVQYCVPEDDRCYYCRDICHSFNSTNVNFPQQCIHYCIDFLVNQTIKDRPQCTEDLYKIPLIITACLLVACAILLALAIVYICLERRKQYKNKDEVDVEKKEEQIALMNKERNKMVLQNGYAESQTEAGDGARDTDTTTLCQAVPNGNIHCSSDEKEGEDVDANRQHYRRSSGSVLSQEISETDQDHPVGQNSRNRNRNTADKTITIDDDNIKHSKNKCNANGSGLPNELKTMNPAEDKEGLRAVKVRLL